MKKEIHFDHNAKSLSEALGVSADSFATQLAAVMAIYDANDETKVSRLSQLLHACIDYKILLLMATTQLVSVVEHFQKSSSNDEFFTNLPNN